MGSLLDELAGGDRRSIGRVDEVVANVLDDPALFDKLFHGIVGDDLLIRMRAADAAQRVTAQRPACLP